MKLMLEELYTALRLANVPEKEATAAASAVADFQTEIGVVKRDLAVVKWITGATFAGVVAIVLKTFLGG